MDTAQQRAHLAEPAHDLEARSFRTELRQTPGGPELVVTHPQVARLTEQIHVEDGTFRWSRGQAIAPVGDKLLAIRHVARVLSAVEG
ncbi:hypothetical protein ACIBF1_19340 [Spirillospora sp. NPDC050679]